MRHDLVEVRGLTWIGLDFEPRAVLSAVTDRIKFKRRGLHHLRQRHEGNEERVVPGAHHVDARVGQRFAHPGRGVGPGFGQMDEVAVGVENDHRQACFENQVLQDHSQRVGLARAALTTQERVPIESLRNQAQVGIAARHVPATDLHRGPGGRLKGFDLQWTQDTHHCLGERIPA